MQAEGDALQDGMLDAEQIRVMTLEAYADTILPGEKRWPGDRAIAGVAEGGGSVQAGALAVLELPESGLVEGLQGLAEALNAQAQMYAAELELRLDPSVPPFVALAYPDRAELVRRLTAPGYPAKELWVGLAVFCTMAFDAAPHLHTVDALETGHPGLAAVGLSRPDPDGLWRFGRYSYDTPLASLHPNTTSSGSPA